MLTFHQHSNKEWLIRSSPSVAYRVLNHWSNFRGFKSDAWLGFHANYKGVSRSDSIFSWRDLASGHTERIEQWARLLSAAGLNGIAPSDINWQQQNNFMLHLDQVATLARVLGKYGIDLYWSPSSVIAANTTAVQELFRHVPSFAGFVLKFGSEDQTGNPSPSSVNILAKTLQNYGAVVLLRGL